MKSVIDKYVNGAEEQFITHMSKGLMKHFGKDVGERFISLMVDGIYAFHEETKRRNMKPFDTKLIPCVLLNKNQIIELFSILRADMSELRKPFCLAWLGIQYSNRKEKFYVTDYPTMYIMESFDNLVLMAEEVSAIYDDVSVTSAGKTMLAGEEILREVFLEGGFWRTVRAWLLREPINFFVCKFMIYMGYAEYICTKR